MINIPQLDSAAGDQGDRVSDISADQDERTIAAMMQHVEEDPFFWASDSHHPDHPGAYLEELRERVAPMSESARRAILGENVARAYNLR